MARFNGTRTPLAGNAETSLDMLAGREDYVVGMVFADQAGTIYIEQSMSGKDGEWDISTEYVVTANDGKGFKEDVFAPYVRVRYVNGPTAQGAFRMTARFSSAGSR